MKTLKEWREIRKSGCATRELLRTFLQEHYEMSAVMSFGEDAAFRSEILAWKDELGVTLETLNAIIEEHRRRNGKTPSEKMVDDMIDGMDDEQALETLEGFARQEGLSVKCRNYVESLSDRIRKRKGNKGLGRHIID